MQGITTLCFHITIFQCLLSLQNIVNVSNFIPEVFFSQSFFSQAKRVQCAIGNILLIVCQEQILPGKTTTARCPVLSRLSPVNKRGIDHGSKSHFSVTLSVRLHSSVELSVCQESVGFLSLNSSKALICYVCMVHFFGRCEK